jgi:hypothetical protein
MKEKKIIMIILSVLILTISSPCFSQRPDEYIPEIKNIRDDIQIINLINSLDLDKEQIEFIISKAKEVKRLHNNTLNQIKYYATKMNGTYEKIKDEVGEGKLKLHRDVTKDFRENQEKIKKIMRDEHSQIENIASEIESKLESFQLIALDEYKPCIIPIVSNGHIGQSDSGIGISKVLERVKSIPAEKYNIRKYFVANHLLERIKKQVPPDLQLDERKIKSEILEAFDNIRGMDDVDFQLKKKSIAEELKDKILPERPSMSRKAKIKKFLLSENTIPILEERLTK